MKDTIIKGSGNSRSLKTVPNALTLYPTHEAMVAAMVDGTFPIDLGPLNTAGVQERGMDLNKENLLKDATAALYGLSGDDTSPDDVLAAIAQYLPKIGEKARIATGSWVGTATPQKPENHTILFGFNWKFLVISKGASSSYSIAIFEPKAKAAFQFYSGSTSVVKQVQNVVNWGDDSITVNDNLNFYTDTFYYIVFG